MKNGLLFAVLLIAQIVILPGCKKEDNKEASAPSKVFPKNLPQPLDYPTISAMISDMDRFSRAVKAVNHKEVESIDERYRDVYFETQQQPLLLNLYPDPTNGRIIHLVVPKDPKTGSDYVLHFEQKLPIIDSNSVLLELHPPTTDAPLSCPMQLTDIAAYMKHYQDHKYEIRYKLSKRFSQSGTYDFDALRFPAYRSKGLPFIVFEIVSAQLTDLTTKQTIDCK